jgi:hypothetical protein
MKYSDISDQSVQIVCSEIGYMKVKLPISQGDEIYILNDVNIECVISSSVSTELPFFRIGWKIWCTDIYLQINLMWKTHLLYLVIELKYFQNHYKWFCWEIIDLLIFFYTAKILKKTVFFAKSAVR